MSICACCNRPMEPDWAQEHNLCPVCWRSGCTAFHSKHSEGQLAVHEEKKLEKRKREHQAELEA
ncbi:hypothetical protein M193_gp062 [Halorubrum tailed phage 7]|uniref:Uncharacterized protein n=1 Tax=Halorubrum sodomense tailed virus 2 TaxID=1262527 RepID=L7TN98_9CAUD|nr:hypothetical protein HSTV2_63 [Halorubrum sodomense tailed virus 2]YP_008060046.1 hypothetical protein M193_gp062 [Halorubrum tailed phage 7]AGC34332.1 hypothetical protein HSTV2_63 [Halorubrum sodomense tailed virus 2]AGM10934.1 hypothetical protein HRTV7_62 [Halorubrum tailed phage 7]UBF22213.1 hypothetical protein HRTV-2_gp65 [Halorubrum virus HRTV-2]